MLLLVLCKHCQSRNVPPSLKILTSLDSNICGSQKQQKFGFDEEKPSGFHSAMSGGCGGIWRPTSTVTPTVGFA